MMIAFYLAIPLVAGYTAHAYGRSFWKWFLFTCAVPAVSYLALYIVLRRDLKRNKLKSLLTQEEIDYMDKEVKTLVQSSKNPPLRNQKNT
ncbi:MAG: hypothetical protein NXI20_27450 [bacterium]|nr:hypothetical protein [bacterium]